MPNSIALAEGYTNVIDEVYKAASVSDVLTSDQGLAQPGANAKEIKIPKISVDGLGDYSRSSGYVTGSVTLEWETKTFEYDRGTKIVVDAMDVEETAGADAFVKACSELQRTQVAPEGDAYTFAKICGKQGIGKVQSGTTYSTAADAIAAIGAAMTAMDEAEVPTGSRYLFITPTLKRMIDSMGEYQATVSKEIMDAFAGVVEVPQSRFYTAIALKSGGEDGFGYAKATAQYAKTADVACASGKTYYTKNGNVYSAVAEPADANIGSYYELTQAAGLDINFLIVEKSAVIKFDKHVASRVFSPDELENMDAYMQKYRKYGIVDVFDNKVAGIFLSHKAS
ncbi:MAG: hypothetical protein IKG69_03845 [Atopobiaceae bacterium]|nr:hypothetical protein [Atopobiaceae bacterium]